MAVTIQDFLVSLGYKVDQESQRKFYDNITESAKRIGEMGAAIEVAAAGIIEYMHRISEAMEQSVITANRLGGSVGGLNAVADAIGQLGGNAGRAKEQMAGLASRMEALPGLRRQIENVLGIRGQGHNADQILGQDMPRFLRQLTERRGIAYALQYGQQLFQLSPEMIRAMVNPQFERQLAEQQRIEAPRNREDVQKNLEHFLERYRNTMTQFGVISDEAGANIEKKLGPQLDHFYEWLSTHHDEIVKAITDISNILLKLAKWVLEAAIALDKFAEKHPGWAQAFIVLGVAISGIIPGLGLMLRLLTGLAAMVMPEWLLGLLGLRAGATAAGAAGAAGVGTAAVGVAAAAGLVAAVTPMPAGEGEDEFARQRNRARGGTGAPMPDDRNFWERWAPYGWGGRDAPGYDRAGHATHPGASLRDAAFGGSRGGKIGKWWTPERMKHAADRLVKEAGLSPMGAAGLVARWAGIEASTGPQARNFIGGGHWGIAQWGLARGGRSVEGMSYDDQLTKVIGELNSTEYRAAHTLRSASDPEQGSRGASQFERAEQYNEYTGMDAHTRRTPTQGVYDTIYGNKPAADPAPQAPPSGAKPQAMFGPGAAYAQLGGAGLGIDASVTHGDIDRSVTLTQNVTNNIEGAGDPAKVGEAVASRMQRPIAETLRGFSSGVA